MPLTLPTLVLTAAAMYWSAMVRGSHELPPRRLRANLVATIVPGKKSVR